MSSNSTGSLRANAGTPQATAAPIEPLGQTALDTIQRTLTGARTWTNTQDTMEARRVLHNCSVAYCLALSEAPSRQWETTELTIRWLQFWRKSPEWHQGTEGSVDLAGFRQQVLGFDPDVEPARKPPSSPQSDGMEIDQQHPDAMDVDTIHKQTGRSALESPEQMGRSKETGHGNRSASHTLGALHANVEVNAAKDVASSHAVAPDPGPHSHPDPNSASSSHVITIDKDISFQPDPKREILFYAWREGGEQAHGGSKLEATSAEERSVDAESHGGGDHGGGGEDVGEAEGLGEGLLEGEGNEGKKRKSSAAVSEAVPNKRTKLQGSNLSLQLPSKGIPIPIPSSSLRPVFNTPCSQCARTNKVCEVALVSTGKAVNTWKSHWAQWLNKSPTLRWGGPWSSCAACRLGKRKCDKATPAQSKGLKEGQEQNEQSEQSEQNGLKESNPRTKAQSAKAEDEQEETRPRKNAASKTAKEEHQEPSLTFQGRAMGQQEPTLTVEERVMEQQEEGARQERAEEEREPKGHRNEGMTVPVEDEHAATSQNKGKSVDCISNPGESPNSPMPVDQLGGAKVLAIPHATVYPTPLAETNDVREEDRQLRGGSVSSDGRPMAVEDQIKTLQGDLPARLSDLQAAQNEHEDTLVEVVAWKEEITAETLPDMEERLRGLEDSVECLHDTCGAKEPSFERALAASDEKVTKVVAHLDELEAQVQEEYEEVVSRLDSMEAKMAKVEQTTNALGGLVNKQGKDLAQRVKSLESHISNRQTDGLTARLKALEGRVGAKEVGDLLTRLQALEGRVSAKQVGELLTRLQALESRSGTMQIEELLTRLNALEGRVGAKQVGELLSRLQDLEDGRAKKEEMDSFRAELRELKEKAEELEETLEAIDSAALDANCRDEGDPDSDERYRSLEEKLGELEGALKEHAARGLQQVVEPEAKMRAAEVNCERREQSLKQRLDAFEQNIASANASLSKQEEERCQRERSEVQRLQADVKELQDSLNDQDVSRRVNEMERRFQDDIATLRAETTEQLQATERRLAADLSGLNDQNDLQDLPNRVDEMEQRIKDEIATLKALMQRNREQEREDHQTLSQRFSDMERNTQQLIQHKLDAHFQAFLAVVSSQNAHGLGCIPPQLGNTYRHSVPAPTWGAGVAITPAGLGSSHTPPIPTVTDSPTSDGQYFAFVNQGLAPPPSMSGGMDHSLLPYPTTHTGHSQQPPSPPMNRDDDGQGMPSIDPPRSISDLRAGIPGAVGRRSLLVGGGPLHSQCQSVVRSAGGVFDTIDSLGVHHPSSLRLSHASSAAYSEVSDSAARRPPSVAIFNTLTTEPLYPYKGSVVDQEEGPGMPFSDMSSLTSLDSDREPGHSAPLSLRGFSSTSSLTTCDSVDDAA